MSESALFAQLNDLFSRLDPGWDPACAAVLSDLVEANQAGHVCLPLASSALRRRLSVSPVVGAPGGYAPLVLDEPRGLYFANHWFDETRLAERLLARAACQDLPDPERVRPWLDRLFPDRGDGVPDRQRMAAALALRQSLLVISGGPGTGKTTTVVRLLALLAAMSSRPLVMAMAAPTGKAAARLSESVRQARDRLPVDASLKEQLPDSAQTLHRLLGLRPGAAAPRYHGAHPLPLDVLVVDEASMVDLGLMAQMADALPSHARLILLGDRDQLASVEAGAVLSDMCQRIDFSEQTLAWLDALGCDVGSYSPVAPASHGLTDCVALLTHSHRFAADSGIGALSRLVNAARADEALDLLQARQMPDLHWRVLIDLAALCQRRAEYWQRIREHAPLAEVQRAFVAFMPLVSERRQVEAINRAVEAQLEREGGKQPQQVWYPGRAVMISTNDYALELFNGDIGFTIERPEGLRVAFPDADGGWRELAPGRLPAHETVFAMTVHKSQGSEFAEVWLVLPDSHAALLNRALVYTALTRARQRFEVCGEPDVLRAAILNDPPRFSGLAQRLHSPLGVPGKSA